MTPEEKKKQIQEQLHSRMVQTYGEDYENKDNAIKDAVKPASKMASGSLRKGSLKSNNKRPNKVFTDKYGDRYLKVPVSFNVPIYLDKDEKDLTLNEIKNRLDEIDSMELVDLIFDSMDYKNVIKK